MSENDIKELLAKYTSGTASPEEITLCNSLFNSMAKGLPDAGSPENLDLVTKRVWNNLNVKDKVPTHNTRSISRYVAAAAMIIFVGLSILFALYHQNKPVQVADIKPGGNKATLTLANGQKIVLDARSNGKLASISGGESITNNNATGVVIYAAQGSSKQEGTNYMRESAGVNTISTPLGGQYHLVLADGTRVFLNATSSLKFPSRFAGSLREVTLQGEAYFEVAKNPQKPFIVTTEGQQVKVLGTHFDVSAYPGETIKTTLAEGSVQLTHSSSLKKQLLKPEQQALLTGDGFELRTVNSADEIAWKDGLFVFKKTPLRDVMNRLARWYNVDIDVSNIPDQVVSAKFPKTYQLSEILNAITYSYGIKFNLEGRRLSVTSK